jgi:hypothetical protein
METFGDETSIKPLESVPPEYIDDTQLSVNATNCMAVHDGDPRR